MGGLMFTANPMAEDRVYGLEIWVDAFLPTLFR